MKIQKQIFLIKLSTKAELFWYISSQMECFWELFWLLWNQTSQKFCPNNDQSLYWSNVTLNSESKIQNFNWMQTLLFDVSNMQIAINSRSFLVWNEKPKQSWKRLSMPYISSLPQALCTQAFESIVVIFSF